MNQNDVIENIIEIPIYEYVFGTWHILSHDKYIIRYLKHTKKHNLRIVVNDYITKEKINTADYKQGYRKQLLKAISEYRNEDRTKMHQTKKGINFNYLNQNFTKERVKNVKNYLLPIKTEISRDILTEYNLY